MLTTLTLLFALPSIASEGTLSAGVTLALSADQSDAVPLPEGGEPTRFGPGLSLGIPLRLDLTEGVRLRLDGRFDLAAGSDRITWGEPINGEEVRFWDSDHPSYLVGGALLVGVEAYVPSDLPFTPYLGGGVGMAWIGTYHSFHESTAKLMDPEQNDLNDANNIDPYTSQLRPLSELVLGARRPLSEASALNLEVGYALAFLPASDLHGTLAAYNARREAYSWNAIRLALGFTVAL
ncbi:MAG: hypothetical protein JXX28_02490 [Deltaproteobacteria bacterium]|nr:hypothetical protein [Deltaproteobacteria bacterium]